MQEQIAAPNPIWYPFTQMQTAPEPVEIVRGEGPWLFSKDGYRFLDGISSWWVTIHGHSQPHIAQAIALQATQLEQVIFAGFTHPQALKLAQRLVEKLPTGLEKVFFLTAYPILPPFALVLDSGINGWHFFSSSSATGSN